MLSDVLYEAVSDIREYQKDGYSGCKGAIDRACEVMDRLRQYFDSPPAPVLRESLAQLLVAIEELDLSRINSAGENVMEVWRQHVSSPKTMGKSA